MDWVGIKLFSALSLPTSDPLKTSSGLTSQVNHFCTLGEKTGGSAINLLDSRAYTCVASVRLK